MNITQRLTVQSTGGALHVVAVWRCLVPYTDRIGGVSAHADAARGAERLGIDVVDVCEHPLLRVVAVLNPSRMPITATVAPAWRTAQELAPKPEQGADREQAGRRPEIRQA